MLDDSQQLAVNTITRLDSNLYLLTGAGGSGKTYTLQHLLDDLWDSGGEIKRSNTFMAAPTGKAAKVITDSLPPDFMENSPSTIHRMLDYNPRLGWGYNERNKLPAALVIIDEASMVDSELMSRVIEALPVECLLILVGDVNQLPPVGPGQPFADLIHHGNQGVVCRLTTNHRQTQGSLIADGCLKTLAGEGMMFGKKGQKTLGGELYDDLFFHDIADKHDIPGVVLDLCKDWHADGLDYAVLAPQHSGVCGVEEINRYLQDQLNPYDMDKPEISTGFSTLRLGDKVLQTKNNYDLGVFNGFTGAIVDLDRNNRNVVVDFDGDAVVYQDPDHVRQLALGYCMTIHKSQGSQFKYGVLIAHSSHYFMQSRTLLYTGVSRFREELHVVGDKKALRRGAHNVESSRRNTYLKLCMEKEAV